MHGCLAILEDYVSISSRVSAVGNYSFTPVLQIGVSIIEYVDSF
jgi:hypothetical protein